ncbi:hypothetical protein Bcp1_183 [Bacillus phage Bcp1]|uniref:Uncharacterized protein n=1 Tax=Bacillus phage Bcp1 TaxID=584892 RepID=X2JNF7_9CAUD|nr:hypothetical protein Bcp1_183 [Bacillus phage Bcp1]AHN66658.1 hypothetical protein Bcp1_183 [Bacillus phage Bcp1]AXQ67669.1 hypothetical protein KIOSHI_187 [Bacillus phage Kioshi]
MITLTVTVSVIVYVLESLFCAWTLTLPLLTWSGSEVEKGLPKGKALKWGFLGALIGNISILALVGIVNLLFDLGDWMINNLP